jgi:GxxExxY protein
LLHHSALTERVIGSAIEVHRQLGPGLLESAYEACLACELTHAGITFERQTSIPLIYRDVRLDTAFKADLIIDKTLILEIKSTEALTKVHESQILTYLRLSGCRIGLLMNFNTVRLKDGIKRFAM